MGGVDGFCKISRAGLLLRDEVRFCVMSWASSFVLGLKLMLTVFLFKGAAWREGR